MECPSLPGMKEAAEDIFVDVNLPLLTFNASVFDLIQLCSLVASILNLIPPTDHNIHGETKQQ
jgi:hypothetical protein